MSEAGNDDETFEIQSAYYLHCKKTVELAGTMNPLILNDQTITYYNQLVQLMIKTYLLGEQIYTLVFSEGHFSKKLLEVELLSRTEDEKTKRVILNALELFFTPA